MTSNIGAKLITDKNKLGFESQENEESEYKDVKDPGSHFLGIHSEGPYLSKDYKAVMDDRFLRNPSIDELNEMMEHSNQIKVMTVACELEGMDTFIPYASKFITCMIGHTNSTAQQALHGLKLGAKGFTHLYNAMSQHSHRNPGCVTAAFLSDAYSELICDGFHVHPDIIKATYKILGPQRIVLITDASLCRVVIVPSPIEIVPVWRRGMPHLEAHPLVSIVYVPNKIVVTKPVVVYLNVCSFLYEVHIDYSSADIPLYVVGNIIPPPRPVVVIVYPVAGTGRIPVRVARETQLGIRCIIHHSVVHHTYIHISLPGALKGICYFIVLVASGECHCAKCRHGHCKHCLNLLHNRMVFVCYCNSAANIDTYSV